MAAAVMENKFLFGGGALAVAVSGALYVCWGNAVPIAGLAVIYVRTLSAPAGTISTDLAPGYSGAEPVVIAASARKGDLIKILWHDGIGMSLYAKRLERGRFIWPSVFDGAVTISSAQLDYMLEGIDWRHPQHMWRPTAAG